jgi:hypothetical protein
MDFEERIAALEAAVERQADLTLKTIEGSGTVAEALGGAITEIRVLANAIFWQAELLEKVAKLVPPGTRNNITDAALIPFSEEDRERAKHVIAILRGPEPAT